MSDNNIMDKINISITKDDTQNDYLFCLAEFGSIPNKVAIFSDYDVATFIEYVDAVSSNNISSKEIIPSDAEYIVNEKIFTKIEDFYVSFIGYDVLSEDAHITDLIIYYKEGSEANVNSFIESISPFEIDMEDVDITEENRFSIINATPDGIKLEYIDAPEADYKNIDLYHNEDTFKSVSKLIKSIKKNKKGLSIIYGERGVGKTILSSYISSNVDKKVIFIPSYLIDIVNTNELKNIIKVSKNSLIVIDDSEVYLSHSHYHKSNILSNNILQLVDGISSDTDNVHILTILNTESIDDIDESLLDCNNIIDIIEVKKLSNSKADKLCHHLKQKNKSKNNKLIDILKKRKSDEDPVKMGFH